MQLAVSPGGAPKLPVQRAVIGPLGMEGDAQRKANHGGPNRAVMLYSVEQIELLKRAGHPIFPGAVGENVTVEGVDFTVLGPGDRLRIGERVLLEISLYPTPCDGIGGAFTERDFTQVWHERHPGMSRLACRVLQGGAVAVGDRVWVVAPASNGDSGSANGAQ